MHPPKVQTVLEWQTPRLLQDVQCFLGFANFYRKLIQDYSQLILPLTQLTKMRQSFVWIKEADKGVVDIKKAFTLAPILTHVDLQKPFIIEADVVDFSLGSILS